MKDQGSVLRIARRSWNYMAEGSGRPLPREEEVLFFLRSLICEVEIQKLKVKIKNLREDVFFTEDNNSRAYKKYDVEQ